MEPNEFWQCNFANFDRIVHTRNSIIQKERAKYYKCTVNRHNFSSLLEVPLILMNMYFHVYKKYDFVSSVRRIFMILVSYES